MVFLPPGLGPKRVFTKIKYVKYGYNLKGDTHSALHVTFSLNTI